MHLMSASVQIPFEICDSWNIQTWISELQLDACLISQGPTLIFTAPVYSQDGLSQKTSLQQFVLYDNLRLVRSFALQFFNLTLFHRLTIGHTLKIRSAVRSTTKPHQWTGRCLSTHLHIHPDTPTHTHTHTEMHAELFRFSDRRTAVKTKYIYWL